MRKKIPGSITIYLSMILLLVLVLVCTLIESGRVSAIKTKLKGITYMGADSVFSEFAKEVFDNYAVMMLWMDDEEVVSEFGGFVEQNINVTGNDLNLYKVKYSGAEVTDKTLITDDEGEVFREQVSDYMKLNLAETAVSTLLSKLNIFDQGSLVSDLMDKIEEYEDVFKKVEDTVSKIKETVDKVKSIAENPKSLLSDLKEYAEGYLDTSNSQYVQKFKNALNSLKNYQSQITEILEDIKNQVPDYTDSVAGAKVAVGDLEDFLSSEQENYDDEIYQAAKDQVDELKETSSDLDADYYNVIKTSNAVEDALGQYAELKKLTELLSDGLSEDTADSYLSLLTEYKEKLTGIGLEDLDINLDTTTTEQKSSGFLDTVTNLFNDGFLGLVAEDVSEKEISGEDLPSAALGSSSEEDTKTLADAASDTFLFGEYVLTHFGNYVDTIEDTALDYEAEYILSGKKTDKENLASVAEKLVLIRSGCNMISLLKSTEMREEAHVLAAALVGFTGMPILIKLMQVVIMAAWSLAESMSDVKTLLSGGKVITIKSKDEWNISIYGLENISSSGISGTSAKKGFSYSDYLLILLLLQNKSAQTGRTMDLIQANMCNNYNESFRVSECVSALTIEAAFSAAQIFVSLPFVKKSIGSGGGNYSIEFKQEYSY